MKKIVAIAVLACNVCFSRELQEPVIDDVSGRKWYFDDSAEKLEEIQFYLDMIWDPCLQNTYKVHILVKLCRIYHYAGNSKKELETIEWLQLLCCFDTDCMKEFKRFYCFI